MKNILLTSISILALTSPAFAGGQNNAGTAKATSQQTATKEMDMTTAKNEAEYRTHLMGLGGMSLMASQTAEGKADNDKVKEFATFEVAEQTAVGQVLKEMKTPKPPMSAKDQATLEQLKSLDGADFDKAYVQASLDTHEKLEDLTENYLKTKASSPAEQHAHHLAMVTLPTIKQHIAQAKEILDMSK